MNLILCGYKACGKTTVGQALAQQLSWDFCDTDHAIVAAWNAAHLEQIDTTTTLCRSIGETAFRRFEAETVQALMPLTSTVIALGGGVVLHAPSVAHLKTLGPLIYLQCGQALLEERLLRAKTLPGLDGVPTLLQIRNYIASRAGIYSAVADATVSVDNQSVSQLVTYISQHYAQK